MTTYTIYTSRPEVIARLKKLLEVITLDKNASFIPRVNMGNMEVEGLIVCTTDLTQWHLHKAISLLPNTVMSCICKKIPGQPELMVLSKGLNFNPHLTTD